MKDIIEYLNPIGSSTNLPSVYSLKNENKMQPKSVMQDPYVNTSLISTRFDSCNTKKKVTFNEKITVVQVENYKLFNLKHTFQTDEEENLSDIINKNKYHVDEYEEDEKNYCLGKKCTECAIF